MLGRNLPPVSVNRFSMVPRPDVPRSKFSSQHSLKTTFGSGYLIPIHVDEVLPGDVHEGNVTIFARLSTLLFPIMDNVELSTFFFFVPCRLVWSNWRKFMGEQVNPGDSIAYTIPQVVSAVGGWPICQLGDYMGLPTVGQVNGASTVSTNSLPMRAYNLIYNEWFRDENLNPTVPFNLTDGPDVEASYRLIRRNKKHDYFTSCLPWPLKGGVDVSLPMAGTANILGLAVDSARTPTAGNPPASKETGGGTATGWLGYYPANTALQLYARSLTAGAGSAPLIYADLSTASGATINTLRLAVTTQQLLERDARGGTRYTELLRAHFGVTPEDARLQRPEYIGGGVTPVQTHAVPQTSATGLTGGSSPLAALGATSVVTGSHRFSYHATEHGYIIGLCHVGGDLTYQQGLPKMWSRSTRYDFYFPAFANLGEQAVLNEEIYCTGQAADNLVFGYQERWAELRHFPSRITGLFRSTSAGTLDTWHIAQKFLALPTLAATFMADTPPLSRVLAAGAAADNAQVLFDSVWNLSRTRPLPQFSVPGLTRF